MEFKYTYTRLNVDNFEVCKAFYRDVLGLTICFEDAMDEYVEFDTGSTKISLINREKLPQFVGRDEPLKFAAIDTSVALTFVVNDLHGAIQYLTSKGVRMANEPTDFPDRGFISACFHDPDGNLVELEQMTDVVIGG
ncbi:MAG: VOC family protein [Elainellaceae cyanobacterium]